jgi:hypothetical protein
VKTSPGTTKRIDVAAATNVIRGVFGGVKYVNAQGDIKFSRYWASGTTLATGEVAKALVYDDPNILFGVQCDGTLTATMIGQLIEFDFSTAGSAATGLSGCQADIANVGSAKTLYIYELLPIIGNAYGANAKIGVLIDKHELLTRAAVAT